MRPRLQDLRDPIDPRDGPLELSSLAFVGTTPVPSQALDLLLGRLSGPCSLRLGAEGLARPPGKVSK